jgi:hypothetical protein
MVMKMLSLPCGTHPSDTVTSLCVFVCGTYPSAPFTSPFSMASLIALSPALTCTVAAPEMLLPSSCSSSLSPLTRWRKRLRLRRWWRKHRLRRGYSIGDTLLELKIGESQVTALRSSPTSRHASRSRFRDDLILDDGCHGSFGRQTNFEGKFHENVWDSGGDLGGERWPLLLQVGRTVGLGTSHARPSSSAQARSCSSSPPTIASWLTLSRSASLTLRTPSV